MWNLKVCTVCLSTESKLYHMDECKLRRDYNSVSKLNSFKGNGLPSYLCFECVAHVKRFKNFQNKCHRANFTLQELLRYNKEIKQSDVIAINRNALDLVPSLSYWSLEKSHYEEVKFQWVKFNRINVNRPTNPPILLVGTVDDNDLPPKKKLRSSNTQDTDNGNKDEIKVEGYQENLQTKLLEISFDQSPYGKDQSTFVNETIQNANSELELDVPNDDNYFGDDVNLISDNDEKNLEKNVIKSKNDDCVDGSKLDEEYANVFLLSPTEQQAAAEVYKLFSHGKQQCKICKKGYQNEKRLKVHMRMHEKHVSGMFFCELCSYYYKTEFLLKTHTTEKHLYKYVCTKCPEVNFDRTSAKQHYIWVHLQKGSKKDANWYESRPSWISNRGGKRIKGVSVKSGTNNGGGVVTMRPVKKMKKYPDDFLVYTPIGHLEQYELVRDRQKTKNYKESEYKCELCYRGFREMTTFNNHIKKHDPKLSGPLQCDICKLNFENTRKMYKHMIITHLYKYSCQLCDFVCYNRGQAHGHYRWHNNVTYPCPQCKKEFTKSSTRLTHIRIKHPSTDICNICGHSFVSETGLYFHKQKAHTKEEIELSEQLTINDNVEDKLYCSDCKMQFISDQAYMVHLGSSNKHATVNLSVKPRKDRRLRAPKSDRKRIRKPRGANQEIINNGIATATNCEECGKHLPNDVQARKHYKAEHPGADFLKRYMCDVCGHTTQQYNNLLVHMRTHTNEKPYACHYCGRRFSMPSNRDRHLVVHTGEKRYECEHCHRRFTQSSAVKLHIQTVHLKIPYAPWDKKNRKRRKELEAAAPAPAPAPAPPPHKPHHDARGQYLHAYISYHDE